MGQKKNIEDIIRSERERLKDDPNIVGFGYGAKHKKGKIVPGFSVIYIVKNKYKDINDIKKVRSEIIPNKIEDYPTDVVEQRPAKPQKPTGARGSRIENPLVGGTSTTVLSDWHSFPTGYGTLGGICFDQNTGDEMALSNAHVWGLETGKDVIQPWMPVDEYLEAAVKLFLCGAKAYLFDLVVPSPLTIGLGAAAAGAWIAWIAWDQEDPVRWGQRKTGTPPSGAKTDRESIRLRAEVPPVPMAGRAYTTKTTWDYTRITNQGDKSATVTEDRSNQHVLMAKRVWTDEQQYGRGSRVQICAELITQYRRKPEDYMVVAHCFPKSNPEDVYKRILKPGQCKVRHKRTWSFYGFPQPAKPGEQAPQQIEVDAFQIGTTQATKFYGPIPNGAPNPVTALRIPVDGLNCAVPPCTKVIVKVLHTNKPIKIEAFNAAGLQIGQATGTDDKGVVQELTIDTFEITTLKITGGGGEGYLLGITAEQTYTSDDDKRFQHLYYRGTLDLGLEMDPDEWGIVLYVQTVDNSGKDSDPIDAAKNIGGIVTSANISIIACEAIMLLDHSFDVI